MIRTGKVARYFDANIYFKQSVLQWEYESLPTYETYVSLVNTPTQQPTCTEQIAFIEQSTTGCNTIQLSRTTTEKLYRQNIMNITLVANTTTATPNFSRLHIQYIDYNNQRLEVNKTIDNTIYTKTYTVTLNTETPLWAIVVQNEHLSGVLRPCYVELAPITYEDYIVHAKTPDRYINTLNFADISEIKWQRVIGTASTHLLLNNIYHTDYKEIRTTTLLMSSKSQELLLLKHHSENFTITSNTTTVYDYSYMFGSFISSTQLTH